MGVKMICWRNRWMAVRSSSSNHSTLLYLINSLVILIQTVLDLIELFIHLLEHVHFHFLTWCNLQRNVREPLSLPHLFALVKMSLKYSCLLTRIGFYPLMIDTLPFSTQIFFSRFLRKLSKENSKANKWTTNTLKNIGSNVKSIIGKKKFYEVTLIWKDQGMKAKMKRWNMEIKG